MNDNHSDMPLSSRIEAVLFYKAEPVRIDKLAGILGVSKAEADAGLADLSRSLEGRGIQLVFANDEVMLGTSAAASRLIEAIQKEEVSKDMGRAGLETLAIVLYKGPISRRDIDYIRGVNSGYILRNLLVRGLVERVEGGGKERGYLYRPTAELYSFMGISRREDLPEFEALAHEMEAIAETKQDETETDGDKR